MQISIAAQPNVTDMVATPDDNGPYEVPRHLVLALNGAADAVAGILDHLRQTGQVQPGDVVDTNWPAA